MARIHLPPAATVAQVEGTEIEIESDADRAWQALTRSVDAWWPARRRTRADGRLAFDLEPRGGLVETHADGGFDTHGTLVTCRPGSVLTLFCTRAPGFPAPSWSTLSFALEPAGARTKLTVQMSVFGPRFEHDRPIAHSDFVLDLALGLQGHLAR